MTVKESALADNQRLNQLLLSQLQNLKSQSHFSKIVNSGRKVGEGLVSLSDLDQTKIDFDEYTTQKA